MVPNNNTAGSRLFYGLNYCDATDCVNNHILKVSKIEKNIVFHFDIQLIKNNLRPYFLPYKTDIGNVTHLQYMDELGIIHLDEFTQDTIFTMPFPIVDFRLLTRNFNTFGFGIYGLNNSHIYYDIEEVELYHDHLNKHPIVTLW